MFFPEPQGLAPDADINNRELLEPAMGLQQSVLIMDQYGLWNVVSAVQGATPHPNPEYREIIRNNMQEMTQGYVLLFYFSIWDHYFDRNTSPTVVDNWLTAEEALRFRAIKHVRHCIAHSFDGQRVEQNISHFNQVMSGVRPFHGIQFTESTIDLSGSQIATECRSFFNEIAPQLVARLANDSRP